MRFAVMAAGGVGGYFGGRLAAAGHEVHFIARGAHLDEEGLLKAMKEGYIREAWLDVFREEPLPENHPFWHQPGLVITPHIASITNPENAAKIIAENYRRWKEGKELLFEVDEKKGY